MAKLEKAERDRKQVGSLAEEFRLTHEAKWQAPTLEQMYWRNPNKPHGAIARCSEANQPIYTEVHEGQGI